MQSVRFATYNIECLGISRTSPKPEPKRLEAVEDTIHELKADVLSLTEVPDQESFLPFYEQRLKAEFPHIAYLPTDVHFDRNSVVLSKYPIQNWQVRQEYETRDSKVVNYTRGVGSVDLDIPSAPTRLFVHHSKAGPYFATPMSRSEREWKTERCKTKRHSEWNGLAELASSEQSNSPKTLQMLTGDFNDTPDQVERQFAPLGWSDGLHDNPQISHPATKRRIDYLMVPSVQKAWVQNTQVFSSTNALVASDHLPVVMTILIPDQVTPGS